jgi:two-component system, chemotaxis family, sensor kinase Cph1
VLGSPAFGQADLTNCERELIQFAGSVQPHGVLVALREPGFEIIQVSANALALLGINAQSLLGKSLHLLGGNIDTAVSQIAASTDLAEPVPLVCQCTVRREAVEFEGTVHRVAGRALVVEIEPIAGSPGRAEIETVSMPISKLVEHMNQSIQRFSDASTLGTLCDAVVRRFRDMVGYDRVMVYKFDPDGHGKIISEARNPRLDSLLGHHYPATDIPQRARELYLRNRLRVLVDVNYEACALEPRELPGTDEELDMSMCHLRSMSPLHLQYTKNMGVTATLVLSLVRDGQLWGLIACHHHTPRNVRFSVRSAADLLAEVISTRIAAIENYAYAQVAIQVRRLEQRLVEATSTEGDWRLALFRNPLTLLQPLGATGAALFYDGEIQTSGEVPSTPELRALAQWTHSQAVEGLFSCASVSRANAELKSLTPTASGVLAVRLSASRADYLMWFRKEQLLTVTWAGDPSKPIVNNNPLELSPRRSFAAWSEVVQATALAWTSSELALAKAFSASLADIILQVNTVRLLIAEHQLSQTRATVANSHEPIIIADAQQRLLFANDAFFKLTRRPCNEQPTLDEITVLFSVPAEVRGILNGLAEERRAWRGSLELKRDDGSLLPVGVRADIVPARDGSVLGFFLIFDDLTNAQRAAAAHRRLANSISDAQVGLQRDKSAPDQLMNAVLANASLAAMDIADGNATPFVAAQLEEIDRSTQRARTLYGRVRTFSAVA